MVAHSLSDRFTTNVFVAGDQPTSNTNREQLSRRKQLTVADAPPLNIASNNIRAMEFATGGSIATIDLNFLLSISRELRTPLRQLSAPLEKLQSTEVSLSDSERNQLYSIIGLHTAHLLNLVDQLLDTHHEAAAMSEPPAAPTFQESRKSTPKGRRCSTYDDTLLEKLFLIMEENLEETGFNVQKMCSMLHLSHMHLIRKVKQLTGKKPIDLLKSYRLRRAKELLRQNNLNVAEVAYKVGYDMPNSFSRAFKKEFGISPTEYTY